MQGFTIELERAQGQIHELPVTGGEAVRQQFLQTMVERDSAGVLRTREPAVQAIRYGWPGDQFGGRKSFAWLCCKHDRVQWFQEVLAAPPAPESRHTLAAAKDWFRHLCSAFERDVRLTSSPMQVALLPVQPGSVDFLALDVGALQDSVLAASAFGSPEAEAAITAARMHAVIRQTQREITATPEIGLTGARGRRAGL